MEAEEERMKFLEHGAQVRRDALRQKNRNARADAQEFDMRDGAQAAEEVFQFLVGEQQWIAAAQEDVADARVLADVFNLAVELRVEIVAGGVAHQPRTGAVTAIGRAPVGHQEQHAVRVAMHQSRHGRMGVFAAGVAHLPRGGVGFLHAWDDLPADGAILVGGVNEVEEIGRDGQGQFGVGQHGAGVFFRGQRGHEALQLFQGSDAMFELPAPVVPVAFGDIGPEPASGGVELFEGIQANEAGIISRVTREMMLMHFGQL